MLESVAVDGPGEREAGIPADEPGAEMFDDVGVGGLDLGRIERLEIPPTEVQRQQEAAVN